MSGDPIQCSRDEDCPTNATALVCVDALCVEDPQATSSTSDSGTDGSTGAPVDCGPAAECVPGAPPGWFGPVMGIKTQREPAACPDPAPMDVATGHAGLIAPPAVCDCQCDVTDMGCDVTVFGAVGECSESIPSELFEDTCTPVALGLLPSLWTSVLLPARYDGCSPLAAEQIEPARWSEHIQLCEAPQGECGSGVCAPIPDPLAGAATCIWREGEHACPGPGYPEGFLFHEGVRDERDCMTCSCGERASCWLRAHEDQECGDDPVYETNLDEEKCISAKKIIQSPMATVGVIVTSVGQSTGACEHTEPAPIGAATEVDSFTVCCRP